MAIEQGPQFYQRSVTRPDHDYQYFGSTEGDHGTSMLTMGRHHDRYRDAPPGIPDDDGALFGVRSHATPWEVYSMAVTPGHEHHVPTLLGLAGQHALRTSSRMPEASTDLSINSHRMVNHLAERGIIEFPKGEILHNSIEKGDDTQQWVETSALWDSSGSHPLEGVPEHEASRASHFTRALLRASRPARSAGAEQGRLW